MKRERWFILVSGIFLGMLLILWLANTAKADCGSLFHKRQQVVVQQVVQPLIQQVAYVPAVQYRLGQDIEAEALAEKVSRRVMEQLRLQDNSLYPSQGLKSQPLRQTFLASKCAGCHTGALAKAGVVLDGSQLVDDYTFRRIVEMTGANVDVPPPMRALIASLTPQEKGQLLDDIIGQRTGRQSLSYPVNNGYDNGYQPDYGKHPVQPIYEAPRQPIQAPDKQPIQAPRQPIQAPNKQPIQASPQPPEEYPQQPIRQPIQAPDKQPLRQPIQSPKERLQPLQQRLTAPEVTQPIAPPPPPPVNPMPTPLPTTPPPTTPPPPTPTPTPPNETDS